MSIEKEDNIVWISQILFRGKGKIPWEEVEEYLKQYVGKVYEISKTKDKIHIKADFPDEFSNSMDTVQLKQKQMQYRKFRNSSGRPKIKDFKKIRK